jgi:lipid-A-disaccharide synthase
MANPRIFLSAGEASGEHYGALLMTEIRRMSPNADFFGLGGSRMAGLGLRRVVRAEDVAVMGITEVILHMPHIYREYRRLKASLRAEKPDLAILIDFPDVNLGLARELHRLKIPVVFFVSPQLWAWKKWRIRQVRRTVTRMLVIFPFEESFYRERGVEADFVGHPLADLDRPTVTREAFARENGLDTSKFWVGLLPGSCTPTCQP